MRPLWPAHLPHRLLHGARAALALAVALAVVLGGSDPAQAIGLCEDTANEFTVTHVAADGVRVAVARERETCTESESGETRTTERWLSVVGARGKPTQMFFDDADPKAYRAFAQKVAGLARPASDRESFFKTGGFKPAVSALDTPSSGGCTAKVVRLRAKDAAKAPTGDDDFAAYGLWLDVSKDGKRLAHLWLGAGEDSVAKPAYAVHPVWLPGRPGLAVDYRLTELGHSLFAPLSGLLEWAAQNADMVKLARLRFDADAGQV